MKKGNKSVAPESKGLTTVANHNNVQDIICGGNCGCIDKDICVVEEPAIDEAVSVEALAEREYPFTEKHPNALHLPIRISERKAYMKGYTAALSVNKQPEKEVDTIEQETLLQFVLDVDWLGTKEFCNKFGYPVPNWQGSVQVAVMDMLTVDAARWKVVRDKAKELKKEQHTAGNHLKSTHVPISEVDRLRDTMSDLRNQIHELEVRNDDLQNELICIKSAHLIKPQ